MPWGTIATSAFGGLLTGGLNSLFSAQQRKLQKESDKRAFENQLALLQVQQQWAERMANSAHQREVADLRKAGLNPILSAGGQGAMVPAVGSSAVSTGSKVDRADSPEFDLVGAMNTASATDLNKENANKAKKEAQLTTELLNTERLKQSQIKAQTAKTVADTAGVLDDNKGKAAKGKGIDVGSKVVDSYSDLFSSARSRREVLRGTKEIFQDPLTYIAPGLVPFREFFRPYMSKNSTPPIRSNDPVVKAVRGAGRTGFKTNKPDRWHHESLFKDRLPYGDLEQIRKSIFKRRKKK